MGAIEVHLIGDIARQTRQTLSLKLLPSHRGCKLLNADRCEILGEAPHAQRLRKPSSLDIEGLTVLGTSRRKSSQSNLEKRRGLA